MSLGLTSARSFCLEVTLGRVSRASVQGLYLLAPVPGGEGGAHLPELEAFRGSDRSRVRRAWVEGPEGAQLHKAWAHLEGWHEGEGGVQLDNDSQGALCRGMASCLEATPMAEDSRGIAEAAARALSPVAMHMTKGLVALI
mmetsp:Transcript_944/g.3557  ORF Transcript_944/g.3557 Transcript_944/m.3557 type:complete len:141 (+) Transcript_944:149-571(+)